MGKPQTHQLTTWLVFLLILGGFLTLIIWFPFAYVWATYEDLYGEWAQWYQYVAVLLLAGWLALRPSPYRWFYLALALACFYTAGEEISWGQRLFGFGSPEFFDEHNLQEETNLHNFLTGPVDTWTNDLMQYAVATALLGYGLVYPLLLRFGWGLATWVRQIGIPAPPLELWPFFATAALFELGLFHFNEAEIAEILVGTAMMFMLAGHVYRHRDRLASVSGLDYGQLDAPQSRAFATGLVLLVVGVAALAITTTQLIYRDPDQRGAIDQRVLNGFAKYGNRYGQLGLWARAAAFYARAYEAQSDRTDLLGELVTSLQEAGDDLQYRKYARELMERTLTAEQRTSRRVAEQLAVSNSYREIGAAAKASEHLDLARQLAEERVLQQPTDPEAAYTLGMVYEVLADYSKAREQYGRARTLLPSEARYGSGYQRVDAYLNKTP